MADPRVSKFANILVQHSARVVLGDRILLEGTTAAECRVTSTILDRDGNPAEGAQVSESKSIAANGEYEFVQRIRVISAPAAPGPPSPANWMGASPDVSGRATDRLLSPQIPHRLVPVRGERP